MYKMLILEDEIWISSLIQSFVKKNFEMVSPIVCCDNGVDALDILEKETPDVALIDINVPLLNGLEVIEKAQQNGSRCRFIIITGYKDFDYVRSALKAGVIDYLLKPIDETELCSVLNHIFEKLQSEQDTQNLLTQNSYLLKMQFFKQLFWSESNTGAIDPLQYGFSFQGNLFQCIIIKLIHQQLDYILPNTLELIYKDAVSMANHMFTEICYDFFCFHQGSLITIILNPSKTARYKIFLQEEEFFDELLKKAQEQNLNLSIGISEIHHDNISSLNTAHQEAFFALNHRISRGLNKAIFYGKDTPLLSSHDPELLTDNEKQDFAKCIISQDLIGLVRWFRRIIEKFEQQMHVHESETIPYLPLLEQIAELFCQEINKLNFTSIDKTQMLNKLDICTNTTELCTAFINELKETLCTIQKKLSENKISASISMACKYINEHLSESLTLESVASRVYLNSTYLSELFKTETGKNFKDYILEKRMELACELLKSPMKISDIAIKAGYSDAKHFSKTFKKYKGISPKEYQRIYL